MAFRIVHGYTVSGYIDACSICSAHPNTGVTDTCTCITRCQYRRCERQQIGNVLPEVLLLKLFFTYIGKRHRSGSRGTGGDNFYFLQVYHPQAVLFMRLRTDTQRRRQQAGRHCMFSHCNFNY